MHRLVELFPHHIGLDHRLAIFGLRVRRRHAPGLPGGIARLRCATVIDKLVCLGDLLRFHPI